jgi:hypothetical protein
MNFVSPDTVRANAAITICAQQSSATGIPTSNGGRVASVSRTGVNSIWESSRKRRLDDEDDVDRRTKIVAAAMQYSDDADMQM